MSATTSKNSKNTRNSKNKDFQEIFSIKANDTYPITKFISQSTGLELIYCEVDGPEIAGYIAIGTVSLDDIGLAHVLEHLIFLGSEEYPYKGVLDILAQKCMSSGTNAWTDCDHTCYTIGTSGEDGFCCLVPIYLEHIFFPLLSETAFITEVHHLTKEGKDGGVIYSEQLAKVNQADYKPSRELAKLMYPNSAYGFECGGALKNLSNENECNLEATKRYHKTYYTPKNTRIIVCGKLNLENFFVSLEPVINKLKLKKYQQVEKPRLDDVEEIKQPITKTVEVAADKDDDDEYCVLIGYLGPSIVSDLEEVTAVRQMLMYLCDSVIGPLEQAFVECDNPLCSSLSFEYDGDAKSNFVLSFEGITNQGDQKKISGKLQQVLQNQVNNFDMIRMSGILLKSIQNELCELELKPRDSLAYAGITDFLYGDGTKESFNKRFNTNLILTNLLKQNMKFWTELLQTKFLDNKSITIFVQPSIKEQQRLTQEESNKINERRQKYGQKGLENLFKQFSEAQEKNEKKIPPEVIKSIKFTPERKFNFLQITRYKNPDWVKGITCDLFFDDIKSNFVYVTIHLDTSSIQPNLRKHLSLFREAITESPLKLDNGLTIPYEDVVAGLSRDILNYSFSYGLEWGSPFEAGTFAHILSISAQIEMDKCDLGFEWLQKILFNIRWSKERLKILIKSMLGTVKELKREPKSLVKAMMNDILFKDESVIKCTSFMKQEIFLKEQLEQLQQNNTKLVENLEKIRKDVIQPKNMTIHVASSLDKLKEVLGKRKLNLSDLLKKVFHENDGPAVERLANMPDSESMNRVNTPRTLLLSTPVEGGGYIMSCFCDGPNSYKHQDLPCLLLAMQYFCQVQGPFFTVIRGSGYAYDFVMEACPNEGTVKFYVNKCTSLHEAFFGARNVVDVHLKDKTKWLEDYLDSAKSSLIFELIHQQKTPLMLAKYSLRSYYKDLPEKHLATFIAKIKSLKISDLIPITEKYIQPLLNEKCHLSIVCPTSKIEQTLKGFKILGYKLEVIEQIEGSFLAKWNF